MLISPDLVMLLLGKLSISSLFLVSSLNSSQNIRFLQIWVGLGGALGMHALHGYWRGILATSDAMKYNAKLVYPVQSPGNVANMRDIAMDGLEEFGWASLILTRYMICTMISTHPLLS
jgi:hypothetical protein